MMTFAVIGKNFGDEGKGLACASLSHNVKKTLIIKHNGGGQAGHTVEDESGKRFIHHQIGSGAEYGADTLLADTFMVDLYQLHEELVKFEDEYGFRPTIYAEKSTKITVIDDVLRNMFIESARGKDRHGSCGMGINECVNRHKCGLSITLKEVRDMTKDELFQKLKEFRGKYGHKNIEDIREKFEQNNPGMNAEYYEMLMDDGVLFTYVDYIKAGIEDVTLVDATEGFLSEFDRIVFETGQGLLLDWDYEIYAPHLTPSKTGLHNIARFLEKRKMQLDEVIYVTRSYVTRHGNGPLPCEVAKEEISGVGRDLTNIDNEWQGSIRYAKHESLEAFNAQINEDMKSVEHFECMNNTSKALLLTHLDETGDIVYYDEGNIKAENLIEMLKDEYGFAKVYTSHSRFGIDTE